MDFRAKEEEKEIQKETKTRRSYYRKHREYPEEVKVLEEIDKIEHTKHTVVRTKTEKEKKGEGGGNRVPSTLKESAQELLDLYERRGVIRRSTSEWRNRVFMKVEKRRDGKQKVRLISDMTLLNEIVEKSTYEIGSMKEILESMEGARCFTIIDLKDGYFQAGVEEEDRHRTAFRILGRTYERCSMPMGCKNSPRIFQKMMGEMLRELMDEGKVAACMDETVVYTKDKEERMEIAHRVMEREKRNSLRKNIKKVRVCREEVKMPGMRINGRTRRPLEMKRNEALRHPNRRQEDRCRRSWGERDTAETLYRSLQYWESGWGYA